MLHESYLFLNSNIGSNCGKKSIACGITMKVFHVISYLQINLESLRFVNSTVHHVQKLSNIFISNICSMVTNFNCLKFLS